MECKVCKKTMVIRDGKFGKFYACPSSNPSDNHGTVSIKKTVKLIPRSFASVHRVDFATRDSEVVFDSKIRTGSILFDCDYWDQFDEDTGLNGYGEHWNSGFY